MGTPNLNKLWERPSPIRQQDVRFAVQNMSIKILNIKSRKNNVTIEHAQAGVSGNGEAQAPDSIINGKAQALGRLVILLSGIGNGKAQEADKMVNQL